MGRKYGDFETNPIGLGEFLRGVELQAEMKRRAEKIEAAAVAAAPVGNPDDPWYDQKDHAPPGNYKESFSSSSGVTTDVQGNLRAYGRVSNSSPHAVAVEYGRGGRSKSPHKNAHHTLGRAMDAARL